MKLLFDFFPILIFFITYKFFDIFIATGTAIVLSIIQLLWHGLKHRHFEPMHVISCLLITVFGGITLISHNPIFIKWKPTLLYWCLALAFLGSEYLTHSPILQRLLRGTVDLPKSSWQRLNFSWVIFFIFMGSLNIYVAHHYSTNTWVNFKLIGTLGFTIIFVILQTLYLAKHTTTASASTNNTPYRRTQ